MRSVPYDKIQKVYNLLLRSEGGENSAAKDILDRLLNKYNLSFDDIEGKFSEEKTERHYFKYKGKTERTILGHIMWKVTNSKECYIPYSTTRLSKSQISCDCTDSQSIEIEFLFDFYRSLYQKEVDTLLEAFLIKHELYGESSEETKNDSDNIDYENLERIRKFMNGLRDETPLKGIENKSSCE